jgi:hypothetical protein
MQIDQWKDASSSRCSRLNLLRQLVPNVATIALFVYPDTPDTEAERFICSGLPKSSKGPLPPAALDPASLPAAVRAERPRIVPSGVARIITEFPILTSGSGPLGITVGPDGTLWSIGHHNNVAI